MRCSSLAGFHGRSQLITTLAFCRFSPAAPESVLKNSRHFGSDLNKLISARRRFCGTEPVCHAKPKSSRRHSSATNWSMRSHSENTITFTPSFSRHSSRIRSNSTSLGQVRSSGSRMKLVSHTIRIIAK